jgi:hypothetical protein
VIDLHLHTTASDGRSTPDELVAQVAAVGVHTMAVTDHDTMAAVADVERAAAAAGLTAIAGIEITAAADGRDVHVLGYFLDSDAPGLAEFLAGQRQERVDRAREIARRLARIGAPIDIEAVIGSMPPDRGKAIARPALAKALIAAGHVSSVAEAFDRYLDEKGPAYVPHSGASPVEAVEVIIRSGGLASLAHPGPLRRDDLIPALVDAGLAAIEAFHSDHDMATTERYREMARRLDLAVTGGSDYHGVGSRREALFGKVSLPPDEFARFLERRDSR